MFFSASGTCLFFKWCAPRKLSPKHSHQCIPGLCSILFRSFCSGWSIPLVSFERCAPVSEILRPFASGLLLFLKSCFLSNYFDCLEKLCCSVCKCPPSRILEFVGHHHRSQTDGDKPTTPAMATHPQRKTPASSFKQQESLQ